MISTAIDFSGAGLMNGDIKREIERRIDVAVMPRLQYHANRLLDAALAEGDGTMVYATEVDGKIGNSRNDFQLARRKIIVRFVANSIHVAVGELARLLKKNLNSRGSTQKWINIPEAESHVRVFYGGLNKPITEVSGTSGIPNFLPGDIIMLTSALSSNVYSNVGKYGARGAMKHAADAIRRKLRLTKRASALVVRAERSRAVYSRMVSSREWATRATDGTPIKPGTKAPPNWKGAGGTWQSAWVISIRYSKLARATYG